MLIVIQTFHVKHIEAVKGSRQSAATGSIPPMGLIALDWDRIAVAEVGNAALLC